jgi:hypothetical protein
MESSGSLWQCRSVAAAGPALLCCGAPDLPENRFMLIGAPSQTGWQF